jgi:16S rRNA (adenine(1408)-N(1))-methyltransferase
VTIDIGTGDGRAVLAAAAGDPGALVIGIDADAASMAEGSRRAARGDRRGALTNVLFIVASAEAPPAPLVGAAHLVTVRFPWGALLRGCLGEDEAVAAGVAALVAPGGRLELTLAPAARDRLDGLPIEPAGVAAAAIGAFERLGLDTLDARPANDAEVATSWGRRLLRNGGSGRERRPVTIRFGRRPLAAARLAFAR